MGSGKTTIGKKLSRRLSVPFFDLDELIEKETGNTIEEIFTSNGESIFRETETKMLRKFTTSDNFVLSTGGGTPCYNDNMAFMKSIGKTVYLEAETGFLMSRLQKSRLVRPLISGMDSNEMSNFITRHLEERKNYYLKADYIISAMNPNLDILMKAISM